MQTQNPAFTDQRDDLSAALRLAAHFGLNEGVCNHFSLEVGPHEYLLNPHAMHWSLIRPSDILHIKNNDAPEAEVTALNIHSAVHKSSEQAKCVLHTHMPYATTLTCIEGGQLRFLHQNSLRFYEDISYDDTYNGLANSIEEGERIATGLGDKRILFLGNHGVIVTGKTVAEAFDRLYYLERACQVQVLAMSTGAPLKEISSNLAAITRKAFDTESDYANQHFLALKNLLEK